LKKLSNEDDDDYTEREDTGGNRTKVKKKAGRNLHKNVKNRYSSQIDIHDESADTDKNGLKENGKKYKKKPSTSRTSKKEIAVVLEDDETEH
jgi:hypothetical protein